MRTTILVLITLAGCGDDDDDGGSPEESRFFGTWTYRAGSVETSTCSESGPDTLEIDGSNFILMPRADGVPIRRDLWSDLEIEIDGDRATVPPGSGWTDDGPSSLVYDSFVMTITDEDVMRAVYAAHTEEPTSTGTDVCDRTSDAVLDRTSRSIPE